MEINAPAEAAANVEYVRKMLAQRSEGRGAGKPALRPGNLQASVE